MRKIVGVFLVVFFVVLVAGFDRPAVFAQEKVVNLNYSDFWPATHKFRQVQEEWVKEIEKRTKGTVKITIFAGGTLTPMAQTYDSVTKGIADIGQSVLSYTKGRFPLMEVTDLPLGHKSGYASTKLMNELYAKFKPKEFDDVKVMYFHTHPPGVLHTKKPVNKLEDLKGMKIRSTGVSAKVVKALGGAPVAMPISEVYDALSKGIIDGNLQTWEAMHGHKLGELVHNTTECTKAAITTGFFIVMNKNKWNSLSPNQQKVIEEVNQEFVEKQGKLWDEQEKFCKDWTINTLKKGHKVIVLPEAEQNRWAERVKPTLDEYVVDAKKAGVPGQEAMKFSMEYLAKH
jgi:TRAP-type C4-dicarboxylate transport system substrate-binding protein